MLLVVSVERFCQRISLMPQSSSSSPRSRTCSRAARVTRRKSALRTSSVQPRRSATTSSMPRGGAASRAAGLPAFSHSSTRLESTERTTKPSHEIMSRRRSSRFSMGTVRSSER